MSQGSGQPPDPYLSTVLKETYRVERLLGKGGMGGVYLATHLRLGSNVAVKLLLADISKNPEAQHRFRREAKVAMDLNDDNIVHIHDYDVTDGGAPYIVMEFLDGEDLATMLHREAPLHLDRVLSIARQIASALAAAHRANVVHRDLKPENIFLKQRANGEEVVKVVDFGIAKVLDSESMVTRTGALMGTPCFMAPEQAQQRAREVDCRADIFSFGCVLYYMLSGKLPFHGRRYAQVLLQILSEQPPPLRSLVPRLPEPVEQVINRALAKAPEDRYSTVDQMMHALSRAAGQSWGTSAEYEDTVETATDSEAELGFAETVAPTSPPAALRAAPEPGPVELQPDATGAADGPRFSPTAPTVTSPRAQAFDLPTEPRASAGRPGKLVYGALVVVLCSVSLTGWLLYQHLAAPASTVARRGLDASLASVAAPDLTPAPTPGAAPGDARAVALAVDAAAAPDARRKSRTPRARPRRKASLLIRARAGGKDVAAQIYVDGVPLGRAPKRTKLKPGTYLVRAKWDNYAPLDRSVLLKHGQQRTVVLELD